VRQWEGTAVAERGRAKRNKYLLDMGERKEVRACRAVLYGSDARGRKRARLKRHSMATYRDAQRKGEGQTTAAVLGQTRKCDPPLFVPSTDELGQSLHRT